MNARSDYHEGSGNHGHDGHGVEFLANAVRGLAVELLNFEHNLFVSVVVLDFPAAEVEVDDFLARKGGLIEQIGEKHRDCSFRADKPDDPQLNNFGLLALPAAESLEEVVGGMEQNVTFLRAAPNEFLHGREGGLSWAAEDEIALVVVPQRADEVIAWIAAIKEQDRSRADGCHELQGLFALGSMNTDHCPGHGNASEHIVGRGDQTLGIVSPALVIKTALGVELLPVLLCCRKIILGAIYGNDRQAMPKIGGVSRPELIGQIHRIFEDISEDGPCNLLPRSCECAAVNGLGLGPQSAATGSLEELARLDVHPFAFATGDKREDEYDQLLKGELACAGKILG